MGVLKGKRTEDLNLELILSPDEAAQGGRAPIGVPSFYPCPLCGGSGRDWRLPCRYCAWTAMIEVNEERFPSYR